MAWDWPIITGVKKRLFPDKPPEPVKPEPITPTIPDVKPGPIDSINYLRALLLLRSIPLKAFMREFMNLPLKQIAYFCGFFVWVYMTYTFIHWLLLVCQNAQ